MKIDNNYQIDFLRSTERLDYDTNEFKIQKVMKRKSSNYYRFIWFRLMELKLVLFNIFELKIGQKQDF